jgi:hypothetical protein
LQHAGVAVAAGAGVALARTAGLPTQAAGGVMALVAGGLAGSLAGDRLPAAGRLSLVVPGALLLATSQGIQTDWARVVVGVTVMAAGAATETERRWPAATPALLVIAAGGVYLTVPDTEHARALVGALAPMAFLGWPLALARVGSTGTTAIAGLIVWTAAVDGTGRPGAIVGGAACLGLLLAEPAARVLQRRAAPIPPPVAITAQIVVVLLASRVAGLRQSAGEAAVVVAALLVAAAAVLTLSRPARR